MVKALDAYTAIWRKGCTPPGSTGWTNIDNNNAFLAQTIVMTANPVAVERTLDRQQRSSEQLGLGTFALIRLARISQTRRCIGALDRR